MSLPAQVEPGAPSPQQPPTIAPAQEQLSAGAEYETPRVEVKAAGKQFGGNWVVRNVSFSVSAGMIFGLFGPSGSGKTTTIRMILGLLSPDEGQVLTLGTAPNRFRARTRASIGYMPQAFVLYPELSVYENLDLVASLYGMGWLKRRKLMKQSLEFVELWDDRRKPCDQLSGGMKRRLELATTLVHGPQLIVVDEPTAGVDPILRAKFWQHFRELRDGGRTIVVTSQYVTEAEYCDQVAVLGAGTTAAVGAPDAIRQQVMGGEIVDVTADGLDRGLVEALTGMNGVLGVRRISYEELQLTVNDAGVMIPQILGLLNERGAEVKNVQEYHPNFDEVFVRLMEQQQVESAE